MKSQKIYAKRCSSLLLTILVCGFVCADDAQPALWFSKQTEGQTTESHEIAPLLTKSNDSDHIGTFFVPQPSDKIISDQTFSFNIIDFNGNEKQSPELQKENPNKNPIILNEFDIDRKPLELYDVNDILSELDQLLDMDLESDSLSFEDESLKNDLVSMIP